MTARNQELLMGVAVSVVVVVLGFISLFDAIQTFNIFELPWQMPNWVSRWIYGSASLFFGFVFVIVTPIAMYQTLRPNKKIE